MSNGRGERGRRPSQGRVDMNHVQEYLIIIIYKLFDPNKTVSWNEKSKIFYFVICIVYKSTWIRTARKICECLFCKTSLSVRLFQEIVTSTRRAVSSTEATQTGGKVVSCII